MPSRRVCFSVFIDLLGYNVNEANVYMTISGCNRRIFEGNFELSSVPITCNVQIFLRLIRSHYFSRYAGMLVLVPSCNPSQSHHVFMAWNMPLCPHQGDISNWPSVALKVTECVHRSYGM